ncbi:MAG: hypothetical protein QME58_02150 [Bacteroidota bacterium]|nr:hypothetical protein [Bacteroidota bacterium]
MKKMNNKIFVLVIIAFVFGCQKPGPVELIDDKDDSKLIDIMSTGSVSDTLYAVSIGDTSGNFGAQNSRYYAKLIYQSIRFDRLLRKDSLVNAEAIFFDKDSPIKHNNRVIAYPSFDVGVLKINDDALNKFPRRLMIPMQGDTLIGFGYQFRKNYELNTVNKWTATGIGSIGSFDISFSSPPTIRVLNLTPRFIDVSEPLNIKWDCTNPIINIFLSGEDGNLLVRRLVPVMHLQIKNTKGEVTIPPKILELIPIKKFSRFVFSFVSESSRTVRISGYPEDVLVHSSSVHSILLSVRP